jgi:hypothetical protein
MNRTLSFLFAAALGATLGALTALEFAPPLGLSGGLAATLGIIVGALTGYIAVDFHQFCVGVTSAGKAAFALPSSAMLKIRVIQKHYRETSPAQKKNGLYFAGGLSFIYSYFGLAMYPSLVDHPVAFGLLIAFTLAAVFLAGLMITLYPSTRAVSGKSLLYWSTIGLLHSGIFIVLPWLVNSLYKISRWLFVQTGVFLKTLFIAVHSERRMLCCLDAMLGTLVGYYAGSWPVGTVAGLAFALVSYELVSKRLLKLQTA